MKKSKIIIPAAAILALSVGASVTGTVAWFTASRTATISANNLAAINTAGDLNVSLTAGHGTSLSSDHKKVELSFLRDVSYDDVHDTAFVALLDTTGKEVLATRQLSEGERDSHSTVTVSGTTWGDTALVDVYYYNSWSATFSTTSTSIAPSYLLFDSTRTVSKIGNGDGDIGSSSIYKAVRVGMTCDSYSFVWAPYTSQAADKVAYISKAGELKAAQKAEDAPVYTTYVNSADEPLYSLYEKAITTAEPVVREGSLKSDALTHKGLLSTTLTSEADATVEFKLWFEGIDPACINTSTDLTTVATKAVKDMSLSFYAIDSTTLGA